MMRRIILENGDLRLEVAPDLGGSVLQFDRLHAVGPEPILRPWTGDAANPVDRAMFIMAPWCNRISGEGLPWDGTIYPLPRLVPDQAMPIHGTALHKAWTVLSHDNHTLRLRLEDHSVPPFAYVADLEYELEQLSLQIVLRLRHVGAGTAPYGMGLHPWFACAAGDLIQFHAHDLVEEDDQCLPCGLVNLRTAPNRGFEQFRTIPKSLLNGTFAGWDGRAEIHRRGRSNLGISSNAALPALHFFSRSEDCGFVCLEPVSHTVDSPHRPMIEGLRLKPLGPGEKMTASAVISIK